MRGFFAGHMFPEQDAVRTCAECVEASKDRAVGIGMV